MADTSGNILCQWVVALTIYLLATFNCYLTNLWIMVLLADCVCKVWTLQLLSGSLWANPTTSCLVMTILHLMQLVQPQCTWCTWCISNWCGETNSSCKSYCVQLNSPAFNDKTKQAISSSVNPWKSLCCKDDYNNRLKRLQCKFFFMFDLMGTTCRFVCGGKKGWWRTPFLVETSPPVIYWDILNIGR